MLGISGVVASTSDGSSSRVLSEKPQVCCRSIFPDFKPRVLSRRALPRRLRVAPFGMSLRSSARRGLVVHAVHVRAQFPGQDSQGETQKPQDRREYLLRYVRDVEPQVITDFVQTAPPQVIEAMQHTITNMLGSLPPQFFDVRISTVGENLTQLMYSVMMSGYMFRNAQYRLELHKSFALLPPGEGYDSQSSGDPYASKAQKSKVQGEVVRWNHETGAESMSAVKYIEQLEDELKMLRGQLEDQRTEVGQNDLLEYIKSLDPDALKELTEGASEDVLLAMNVFIQRLMGTNDNTELRTTSCENTVLELARLLYWLMVVGYSLRTSEVRLDMDLTYNMPPTLEPPDNS